MKATTLDGRGVAVLMAILALMTIGCMMGPVGSAPSKVSVETLAVAPPSLMVGTKSDRTAYLVLDPAKVPPEMTVLVSGEDRGGKLNDAQTFVTRDLKRTFENYFHEVQVVAPGTELPPEPHVVIDVKLDRIEAHQGASGTGGIAAAAVLTWGIGLKVSESQNYLYSFAGESVGTPGKTANLVYRSMFESAISEMLKGYTDNEVHKQVLQLSRESQPSAPDTKAL